MKAIKTKYTRDEILAYCDTNAPKPTEMEAWKNMKPVGREIIG